MFAAPEIKKQKHGIDSYLPRKEPHTMDKLVEQTKPTDELVVDVSIVFYSAL